jgi:hypothetical protein
LPGQECKTADTGRIYYTKRTNGKDIYKWGSTGRKQLPEPDMYPVTTRPYNKRRKDKEAVNTDQLQEGIVTGRN